MKDKVLILMATYNGEKYLQDQLDSLYHQQEVDLKILVRDDGSSDGTTDILKENAYAHPLEWYQGKHINVANGFYELMTQAMNYDINYIAFCDQDDVWDIDKMLIAVNSIRKYTGPSLYYSGQRLVDENLHLIEEHCLNKERSLKTRFVLSDFAGCTGVFNKALLNEVVKYKPDYMLMHDTWVLRVCLSLGGKVIIDTEPRMNYRQHSGNTLGLGHGLITTIRQVKQYLYEYHIEKLTRELICGYGNKMVPEYRELCNWICTYRNNKFSRNNLLNKNNIDFCNRGLNFTYWIKIKLNKL